MDDEQIYNRGGTDRDVEEYAKANGADLTKEDIEQQTTETTNVTLDLTYNEMQLMVSLTTGIAYGLMGRDLAEHAKEAAITLHEKLHEPYLKLFISKITKG